jgi:formamidopyrimidine-DNA glycosylase
MPELAEVEFYRKRWALAATGERIDRLHLHETKKLFRGIDVAALRRALAGATLLGSEARAKQMCFRFAPPSPAPAPSPRRRASAPTAWLGLHLGMSGALTVAPPDHAPRKHDHLVLFTARHALVFADPRMFGNIEFALGDEPPAWWTKIAPALDSPVFTVDAVASFLRRRARAPLKAVLLMQERFPGIGNWMADEILWRATLHPARLAGSLSAAEIRTLWRECRAVARLALATIAGRGDDLPPDLNARIPPSWLFLHRWEDGGRCPKTQKPLARATIGGRTTCWSPARQKLPPR